MKKSENFIIDIDRTLFYTGFDSKKDKYYITSVNYPVLKKVNKLFDNGHEIIIWTGRHWNRLTETKNQLDEYGVKYTTLLMGKPPVDFIVDDRAVRPDEFLEMDI